jgi:4-oxalocrotonate tautomerase
MPEVVVYTVAGRTVEQKRGLVRDMTEAVVKNFGVPSDAVVITLLETSTGDKAKGGVLFSDRAPPSAPKGG